jgi:hypothetical protein
MGVAFVVLGAWILLLSPTARYNFWTAMGVIPFKIPFGDSRAITASWQCTRDGVDVLVHNPCDPSQRLMQYPKLWMLPAQLGWGDELTNPLGMVNVVALSATAFIVMGSVKRLSEAVVYIILLLSPPVLLLVERGNVDGLMFAMVGLGVVSWTAHRPFLRAIGLGAILLSAMLKLYPVLAGWALVRRWGQVGSGSGRVRSCGLRLLRPSGYQGG